MELTPVHLQIIGITVVVIVALGFLFWIVRTVIGIRRGNPMYVLPDTSRDDDNAADDNDDDHTDVHIHPR